MSSVSQNGVLKSLTDTQPHSSSASIDSDKRAKLPDWPHERPSGESKPLASHCFSRRCQRIAMLLALVVIAGGVAGGVVLATLSNAGLQGSAIAVRTQFLGR